MKISNDYARVMRALHVQLGASPRLISRWFGVSVGTVKYIVHERRLPPDNAVSMTQLILWWLTNRIVPTEIEPNLRADLLSRFDALITEAQKTK